MEKNLRDKKLKLKDYDKLQSKEKNTLTDHSELEESKWYEYASHNVGHIFSSVVNFKEIYDGCKQPPQEEGERDPDIEPTGGDYVDIHTTYNRHNVVEWLTHHEHEFPDINFFFCIKHLNSGKIASHQIFFQGFCSYLEPEQCMMIDIGTIPMRGSISNLMMYMDLPWNRHCGGCAGEIEVFFPTPREDGGKKSYSWW